MSFFLPLVIISETRSEGQKKGTAPLGDFFSEGSLFCIISQRFGLYQLVYITALN